MAIQPYRVTFTNRSGTITSGGASQTLAAANSSRRYLLVQNVSAGDLWINFTSAATAAQPSIKLVPGASAEFAPGSGIVPTELVTIIGATTGQAFTAKEA